MQPSTSAIPTRRRTRHDHCAGGNSEKKQRMLHRPQTSPGSRQPTSPASPGKMPPPTPVAPPPQIQAKTQRGSGHTGAGNSKRETEDASPPSNTPTVEITSTSDTAMSEANPHTCVTAPTDPTEETKEPGYTDRVARKGKQKTRHHPPAPQKPKQHPPTAPPEETPPSTLVAPPPRTRTRKRRDQGTPEPVFPTQTTATSAGTQPLARANTKSHTQHSTTDRGPAPQTAGTQGTEEGKFSPVGKGSRPEQRRNRRKVCNRRRRTPLVCTSRFHPTSSHSPLPATGRSGIRSHHLWPPWSSTDYRADAREVPFRHHLKATSETTCSLVGAESSNGPPANVSPCYQPTSSNPGKSSRWISTIWERGLKLGIDTSLL